MIHPIIIYDNSTLREKSGDVPRNFPKLHELIDDMFETMHKAQGIGLSGIQIGIPLNICVVEVHIKASLGGLVGVIEEEDIDLRETFINPKMREWGPLVKFTEGCLSIPYITSLVERPENIEIEYYDKDWNYKKQVFSGIKARVIQHEMDHFIGVLFIDKISKMWEEMIKKPLEQIKDKEINVGYLNK